MNIAIFLTNDYVFLYSLVLTHAMHKLNSGTFGKVDTLFYAKDIGEYSLEQALECTALNVHLVYLMTAAM